jgi:23S rRNA (uridine2479-2'-O)-methyltransferase
VRITTRNARFQQWEALLTNRTKRHRAGEFVVQGVRPITMAVEQGWEIRTLIRDADRQLSDWARQLVAAAGPAESVAMAPDLLAELSEKPDGGAELVAVVGMPRDDPGRVPVPADFLGLVFDRPTQPGNIGSVIRSADAFGAHGVFTTGHAADAYDPRAVRAATGSLFSTPVVRAASHREVLTWVEQQRDAGVPIVVAATDEHGGTALTDVDLTAPTLLLVGNETRGLSRGWREAADLTLAIPITGSASSLNAANAASVVLYEARRQRLAARPS